MKKLLVIFTLLVVISSSAYVVTKKALFSKKTNLSSIVKPTADIQKTETSNLINTPPVKNEGTNDNNTTNDIPMANNTLPTISITPEKIIQGEPVLISISGATEENVAKILLDGKSLWFFNYENKPTAIIGIDLNEKAGGHQIKMVLVDGEIVNKTFIVEARKKVEEPLGIPEKLGGNTPEAATSLVTNLSKENAVINGVKSAAKRFWAEKFSYPLANPIVTDNYGYLRKTGYYTIPHKGADFHADLGTKVMAINSGVIRLARQSTIYGKTVAIDHGLGVVSYYMHLSKIYVAEDQSVKRGEVIGLSGETGYAEFPHLHLSIKIDGISIDPIGFMDLFNN